jgi:DNA helicase-4
MTSPEAQRHLELARARAAGVLGIPKPGVEDDLLGFLTATNGDALLRARAGSGKTTALTVKAAYMIKDLGIDPNRIMMLTFNNAAARSLERRALDAGVPEGIRVRTFHALGQRIVRAHFGGSRRTVFDEKSEDGQAIREMLEEAIEDVINERFFHFCAGRMRTRYDKRMEYVESVGREALISAVGFLRARGYGLHKRLENAWDVAGPIGGNAMKVIMGFESRLKDARLLDGVSVLQAAAWTLEREAKTGVMKMSEAHDVDWIFIDEFQDVSLPYMRLVEAIRNLNGMVNIQGVGDDYQSINGFAGADLSYFSKPDTALEDPEILDLLRNRRSGATIVEWGNQVMREAGFEGADAVPDPANGQGEVREGRVSVERDFHFIAQKLGEMAGTEHETIALVARKWKVGDHSISRLARAVESYLRTKGWSGKITAVSAHGSKGLEYDQVLLLDDGSFPMQHPSRPILRDLISEEDYLREEACLKHVAGTRARQSLVVVSM